MSKEKLEKLEREKYVVERKLTAAMHKEKRLQSELKRLTRSGRSGLYGNHAAPKCSTRIC